MLKKLIFILFLSTLLNKTHAQTGLLRYISAENDSILTDWRLQDNNIRYSVAISGSSAKPLFSNVAFSGNNSIEYACPAGSTTQRIEHKLLNSGETIGLHFDNERYIGFAIKIPDGFTTPTNSVIFCQAWQGDPYGPVAMLKFMPGNNDPFRIKCNIRNTATGQNSADPDSSLWQGYINKNQWYKFVWHIKPRQTGDSGIVRLWINDSLQFSWQGNFGYIPESQGGLSGTYDDLVVKYGIYQPGSNSAHTLLFDEIKAADNYEDAVPFSILPPIKPICQNGYAILSSGYINSKNSYQWQMDDGNGFFNITDNDYLKSSNSNALHLTNIPTSYTGYRLRCISTNQIGITYTIRFQNTWTGTTDQWWHTPNNWSCNIIPDSNTDVIIAKAPHSPIVSNNASCRSLHQSSNTQIQITSEANLIITGK